ncbi:unnamed protein product [Symbiodinium natans]|uniref:Uncharacterized protein n=1 Tax=Symbiodinium natans TaxID=878477 RepID=A0A812IK01_9DINO|nr:unnamed protein product [Symbiodinium natans]
MANAADSQPFFEQHARKIGMEQPLLDKFIAGGVKTVSMAAYAATQPGQPLTDREVSTLCTSLGQNNPTLAQMTVVKRLLFECQTMSLANLKATVEQQPDSVLRKLPGAERAQRLELQAQRLGGLSIEHDLEPAFSVYDAVSTQVEQGSLKYLHPSKIPTRRQELAQGKPTKELVLDASGDGLSVQDKSSKVEAQLGSDMATYRALQRRGLAYDLVGILSFKVHEKWLQKAFATLQTPPPPGFNRPTLQQVLRADRALWMELGSKQPTLTRAAANAPLADARCLDQVFLEATNTVAVNFHFMPTPRAEGFPDRGGKGAGKGPKRWGDGKGYGQWKYQRTDKGDKGQGGKSGFKGARLPTKGKFDSGKGGFPNKSLVLQGGKGETPMPAALRGGVPNDEQGEPLCFGFNLGQCKDADRPEESCKDSYPAAIAKEQEKRVITARRGLDKRNVLRKGKIIQLDLLLLSHQGLLWKWLGSPGLVAVWLAPPCGTSSRAREIPLPGEDEPRPLRSVECPEGLPGLGPSDAERVAKANELYRLTARIWDFCCENDIVVIIENPYRSFFWHCSAIEHILRSEQAIVVQCDFCMMGGSRLKRTALLCNSDLITGLAVTCDGSHEHLPWKVQEGVLATKLETAYPHQFCKHFVSLLLQHLLSPNFADESDGQIPGFKAPGAPALRVTPLLSSATDVLVEVIETRAAQSRRWLQRAQELQLAEDDFKAKLPEHIRSSLRNKRILLFKEMLEASHYADKAVADDLAQGFDLVGHLDLPAGWSTDFRPAFLSLKDLSQLTQETNHQVIKEVEDSSQFLEELWQKSLDEVSKGWSEGPFREQDLPQGAVVSKRFAIQQGNKVRPIDDLSQSHINEAFGSMGKIELHDIETIAASAILFLRHAGQGLLGKTIDLKSAYRQLPLSEEALNMAYVAVKDPNSGEVRFFRLLCLPFGAVAAVHAFIRVSLAICHIGNTFWHLPWSSFYDDFTLLSTRQLATSAEASACFLLDLLGFEFDRDGDKAQPFQEGLRHYIAEASPRIVRAQTSETVYAFTDASQEGLQGLEMGLGAVLFNQEGHILCWFGIVLPHDLAEKLLQGKSKVINELESIAVLLLFILAREFLRGKHVMCYLDNEAARITLLKLTSDSEALTLLSNACALLEQELEMIPFYARVPSKSNVADAPSRLDFTGLPHNCRFQDQVLLAEMAKLVNSLVGSESRAYLLLCFHGRRDTEPSIQTGHTRFPMSRPELDEPINKQAAEENECQHQRSSLISELKQAFRLEIQKRGLRDLRRAHCSQDQKSRLRRAGMTRGGTSLESSSSAADIRFTASKVRAMSAETIAASLKDH